MVYGRARRLRSEFTSADRSVRSARRFGDQVLVEGGPLDTPRGSTYATRVQRAKQLSRKRSQRRLSPTVPFMKQSCSPHFREV